MFNALSISNKETLKIKNRIWTKRILALCWMFWPIPVTYLGIPKIYKFLNNFVSAEISLHIAILNQLIILGIAVFMHQLKSGKSFAILIAIGLSIRQIHHFMQYITEAFYYYPSKWGSTLYSNSIYILINLLLLLGSLKIIRYLWKDCGYSEIFAFHKIKFINNPIKSSHVYSKIFYVIRGIIWNTDLKIFKKLWQCRKWILSFWFVPVIYIFWFKQYFFLYPDRDTAHLFKYVQTMSISLVVALVSLFLYKPCRLINRFGVLLAFSTHIGIQSYAVYHYIIYYYHYFLFLIDKDIVKVYKQIKTFLYNPNSWVLLIDLTFLSIGVHVVIKIFFSQLKNEPKTKLSKKSTNYGSAHFLDYKSIKKLNDPEGIPIGAFPKNTNFKEPMEVIDSIKRYKGNNLIRIKAQHVTLIAPSRSGKGVGIIIPTLLDYKGPVFVTDIKGENYFVTKRAREARGRKVYAFDPFKITGDVGVRINLLESLDPHSPEVPNQAQALADILCPIAPTDSAETRHFKNQCQSVIECLSLYVLFSSDYEEKRNCDCSAISICFFQVGEIITSAESRPGTGL